MKPEALKLLQEAAEKIGWINDDCFCKTVEDARFYTEQALKDIRAAIFMETPAPSMKFNLYDFTSNDGTRPVLGCVHHEEGFKVACDSTLLIAVKDAYPETLEGKNIDKKGEESKYKYPQWNKLFCSNQKTAKGYRIDFDKLADWMKEYNAENKMMGKRGARKAYVKVGPAFFALEYLSRFAKFMKAQGTDILHVEEARRAAACFSEDGSKGLIMPCVCTRIDYKDDYLNVLWETKSDKVMMWEVA